MTTRIAPGVGANLLGQHSAERNQDATAYVGNLDPQVTEELLWELFVQAGPVVNVYVPKDRVTNLHQGYGFVEFRSEEDADYAIKILNMIKLYGKPIRVNKASQDKKSLDVGANLFIGNLDPDVDEKLLYDTFSAFGVIVTNLKALNFRRLILGACWHLLHFLISIMHIGSRLFGVVCYLIPSGILKRHPVVRLEKLQSLAIVFDDEDVKDFPTIIKLLNWVTDFGIRNAILYDVKGVVKNYVSALRKLANLDIVRTDARDLNMQDSEVMTPEPVIDREKLSIELLSLSDGKEAAAKAASLLHSKYSSNGYLARDQGEPVFTDADFRDALKATGFGVSEPELLLVFGPVRCHLGFPPWRARYTEIVHMGPLKSLKYDALVRVIYDFSTKSQNYGR